MTDEFDFDFDVNRGRSGARTHARDSDESPPSEGGQEPPERHDPPDLEFGWDEPADPPELEEPRHDEGGGGGVGGFLRRVGNSGARIANGSRKGGRGTNGHGSGNGDDARGYAARARDLLNRRPDLVYSDEENGAADAPADVDQTGLFDEPFDDPPAKPGRRFSEPPPPAADEPPPAADDDDWLDLADDELGSGAGPDSLTEHDDGPAGPPTPKEGRNLAKDARRRASRRPSPAEDFDEEPPAEKPDRDDVDFGFDDDAPPRREEKEDVDFESVLEHQPQKSEVARRGSALFYGFREGIENLKRVGGERIAEGRDRMDALRERVPSTPRVPVPGGPPGGPPGGGDGRPPPPKLPRRISSRRPRKPKPGRIKKVRLLIIVGGLGLLAIVSTFFGMMMAISQDLPQLENKQEFAAAKNSEVFDDQGNKIGTLLSNNQRILVSSDDISPYMKEAAVAIEDRRFYEHRGVDIQGMFRAGLADLVPGGSTQGASTITEQFVKNALEAQGNRTIFEKFREAALAYQLERHWDKDKILTEYLNTIYFGEGAYGIEAAARTYFGWAHPGCGGGSTSSSTDLSSSTSSSSSSSSSSTGIEPCAKQLTPPEAAMLAGIIASPSAYSPRINPQAAMDRRNLVLEKMQGEGDIDEQEYQDGIHQQLPTPSEIERPKDDSLAPYFTSWLRQQVVDLYGPGRAFGGGLDIHTTIDLDMQNTAQQIASNILSGIQPTASLVVMDNKTATVKAMVGGSDFQRYPFNIATEGHRQAGSAFKAFVLAAALSHGHSPGECYSSQPKAFNIPGVNPKKEMFPVHNYEDKYLGGCVDLTTATKYSDNSVFADLGMNLIPHHPQRSLNVIEQTAKNMGIQTDITGSRPANPAMILGGLIEGVTPLEMTHAFNTLANDGARVSGNLDTIPGNDTHNPEDLGPVAINEIDGPDGKAIAKNHTEKDQVISQSVAHTEQSMLAGVVSSGGTGQHASGANYGKTGTTDNNGDAWFCGVGNDFTICVWVGHRDSTQSMSTDYGGQPVDGGTYPAIIWSAVNSAMENIRASHAASHGSSSGSTYTPPSSGYSGGGSTGGGSTGGGGGGGGAPSGGGGGGGGGGGSTGGGTGGTGL
jgi:penicillin-binding protein 1A